MSAYGAEAYLACLQGRADAQQQQSAAAQIILLNGIKGELLRALQALHAHPRGGALQREIDDAGRVILKATQGDAIELDCAYPPIPRVAA